MSINLLENKMKFLNYFCGNLFLLVLFSLPSFGQAPTATLTNGELHIEYLCFDRANPSDSIRIYYTINFTGQPQFQAEMRVRKPDGSIVPPAPHLAPPTATSSNTYSGYWSSSFTNILNDDASVQTLTLSIDRFRDGTFNWHTEGISGEVIVNLYEIPTPSIANDQMEACGKTATIEINPGHQSETFSWRVENNAGTFEPDNHYITNFTSVPSDVPYKITFKQTNVECHTEIDMDVILLGSAIGEISTDSEVCPEGDAIISFDFEKTKYPFPPYTVEFSDGTETFSSIVPQNIYDITQFTRGHTIYEFVSVRDNKGCFASEEDLTGSAEVKNIAPRGVISTHSEVCGEGTAKIDFNFENSLKPSLPFSVTYTDGKEVFEETITTLFGSVEHEEVEGGKEFVFVLVKDNAGCVALPEDLIGTAVVPNIKPFAHAGYDNEACGNSILLAAWEPLPGEIGQWTTTSETGVFFKNGFSAPRLFNAEFVTDNEYGEFMLKWELRLDREDIYCSSFDSIYVTLWERPVTFGIKDTVIYTYEMNLSADPVTIETAEGFWSVLHGNCFIEEPANPYSRVTGFSFNDDQYIFEWFVINNEREDCTDTGTLTVRLGELHAPNAFSPNGDGVNDEFVILGAAFVDNNSFIVFDKNGLVVYKKDNYGADGTFWDGKRDNGEEVPDGIYKYVFNGDGIKPIKNFLVIKRK